MSCVKNGVFTGTPQRIVENTGRVMWEATQTAFGEATVTTELVENNLRFPGQYYDAETRAHYNFFRDYDPSLGRYFQRDPIGLADGVNTFGYVGGNPLTSVDPYGLFTCRQTIRGVICTIEEGDGPFGDSCGTGWNKNLVPDGIYKQACDTHDKCYETCGRSKLSCDIEFLIKTGFNIPYFTAVFVAGKDAYNQAQKDNYCDVDCKKPE